MLTKIFNWLSGKTPRPAPIQRDVGKISVEILLKNGKTIEKTFIGNTRGWQLDPWDQWYPRLTYAIELYENWLDELKFVDDGVESYYLTEIVSIVKNESEYMVTVS